MKDHIVFDLDGTLSDTQKIHQQIEAEFLKTKGVSIEPHLIGVKYAGRTPQEWISEILREKDITFTKEEIEYFVGQKDKIIISLLKKGTIELMPYAYEILKYLHKKEYRIGLSSGACKEFIDKFIKYFDLEKIVTASTSANEVEKKKPHPDVFLSSFNQLEKIYGAPKNKYVVGDGWSDMEGGYKSGAKTIRYNYLNKMK